MEDNNISDLKPVVISRGSLANGEYAVALYHQTVDCKGHLLFSSPNKEEAEDFYLALKKMMLAAGYTTSNHPALNARLN